MDPELPTGAQVSDAVVRDAELIVDLTRTTTESRQVKRAKARQGRDAAKRQRNPGGRKKNGKKR